MMNTDAVNVLRNASQQLLSAPMTAQQVKGFIRLQDAVRYLETGSPKAETVEGLNVGSWTV